MEKLLIVASAPKSAECLRQILSSYEQLHIEVAESAAQAKERLMKTAYDLAVINSPLKDESGIALSMLMAEHTETGVIILVKEEYVEQVQKKTEEAGVYIVAKPVNPPLLYQAIRFVSIAHRRMRLLRKENTKLVQKVEDLKIIDRAKCCLMQYLKMTEVQAHRHIEKQAMDLGLTKRHIAENILKTYES